MKTSDFVMAGLVVAIGVGATVFVMNRNAPQPTNTAPTPAPVRTTPLKFSIETEDLAGAITNIGAASGSLSKIVDDGRNLYNTARSIFG